MYRCLLFLLLASVLPATAQDETSKPFDVWALQRALRVSDPQLSPDGATVAFVVERVFLGENAKERHVYTVPLSGGEPRKLTFEGKSNVRPRWSPDSTRIAFVSDRSDSSQIWMMDADGARQRQVTDFASEASGVLFSPDGARVVFRSRVFAECGANDACNADKIKQAEDNPVEARLYDSLLYRHWSEWDDGRRGHLFSLALERGEDESEDPKPIDLTPGDYDVPPFSLGGPDGYAISPDGMEVCFTRVDESRLELSTNADLFVVPIDGGRAVGITTNLAADVSPLYSPDGLYIAYRSQARPGYEADRFVLNLYTRETGELRGLTDTLDRWVTGFAWAPDSSRLFFTADDRGRSPIFTVSIDGGGSQMAVYGDAHHGDLQIHSDGLSMVYGANSLSRPSELYRAVSTGGPPEQITRFNDALLEEYAAGEVEEIEFEGVDGARVSGFLVKPPDFSFEKRYPFLLLVHGGPQGAWGQSWSYRWNAQVFAGAGYVVFMPNPRGSTGYGQAFTDAVSGDWGGVPYEDILAGVDHVIARTYIDKTRLVAAGGSYGGYMVNWMMGHTDRFRAFVSHAGVYDLSSFFGATEELWFPIWEFRGAPWQNPEMYAKFSPSNFVDEFRTPTLVIHGQQDHRVPVEQGMQLFTALQMKSIPSKFLYFPDEGHWVLKPRNSVHWYQSVLEWLEEWREKRHVPAPEPAGPRFPVSTLTPEAEAETADPE